MGAKNKVGVLGIQGCFTRNWWCNKYMGVKKESWGVQLKSFEYFISPLGKNDVLMYYKQKDTKKIIKTQIT